MPDSYPIGAQFDSRDVEALLRALNPRQWAFTTAVTLTRTGGHVKTAEEKEMLSVFDRPTPFTLRSLRLQRATPQRQEARVWFKDKDFGAAKGTAAGDYLMAQVHGGERKDKRFERALQYKGLLRGGKQLVPAAGAPKDAYGNVAKPLYNRILSQLQAQHDPLQNESAKSRARKSKVLGRYFWGNPRGRGWGVWERTSLRERLSRMGGGIRPIFLERKKHFYRPRFPFFEVAEQTTAAHLQPEFNKAAEQTVRTARR